MSPEQANQAPARSAHRHLLARRDPVRAADRASACARSPTRSRAGARSRRASCRRRARCAPICPPRSSALLDRALAADPAARFPDAATFGAAIRNVLGDLSVAVGAERSRGPPRRRHAAAPRARADDGALEGDPPGAGGGGVEGGVRRARDAGAGAATVGKTVRLADPGPTPPREARLHAGAERPPDRSHAPADGRARASTTPAGTAAPRSLTPARNAGARAHAAATPARTHARPATTATSTLTGRPDRRDPSATPPPNTPLPPARARGYTPFKPSRRPGAHAPRDAAPAARGRRRRGPRLAIHARARADACGARERPPDTTGALNAHRRPRSRSPRCADRRPRPRAPAVAAGQAFAPAHAAARRATRPSSPQHAVVPETPAYGVQRPPPQDFALARTIRRPAPFARRSPIPAACIARRRACSSAPSGSGAACW